MNTEEIDIQLKKLDKKIEELTGTIEKRSFFDWFKQPKTIYKEKRFNLKLKKTDARIFKEALKRVSDYDISGYTQHNFTYNIINGCEILGGVIFFGTKWKLQQAIHI